MSDQRLTEFSSSAGCAAKIGPGVLEKVVSELPNYRTDKLLVGFDSADDACVYDLGDGRALIQTVDFFPPMVDDPFTFGQIAAANALSDVYAMGGDPAVALNLLCFPTCLTLETVRDILRGGHEKALEASCVVAGGHTIDDAGPKYGMCVTGFCEKERIFRNTGARPGDVLALTKPLGTGILTTALRADMLEESDYEGLIASMTSLNRAARDAAAGLDVHACTDVTGFALLGHARELAEGSGVTLSLESGALPVLPAAPELAKMGLIPAGAYRNREFLEGRVRFSGPVPQYLADIMFDPQTSGGLLLAMPEADAKVYVSRMEAYTPWARIIGRAEPARGFAIEVR